MSWGIVGTAVVGAVASSVVGSALAPDRPSGSGGGEGGAAGAADPFAGQRAQYMPQLQSLMGQSQSFGQSQAQTRLNEMLYGRPAQAATPGRAAIPASGGQQLTAATDGYWSGGGSPEHQFGIDQPAGGSGRMFQKFNYDKNQMETPGDPGNFLSSYSQSPQTWTPGQEATYAPAVAGQDAVAGTNAVAAGSGFSSNDPSYAWRFDQGMDAVNRSAGAAGMLESGNRMTALMNYGQGAASAEYQAQFARLSGEAGRQYSQSSTDYANQFTRFSQLAGANSGQPGAAGQIMANQDASQNQAAGAVASTIGKGASSAFSSWMSRPGESGSNFTSGGQYNNRSAYASDNSSIGYMPDTNNYSPVW